LAGLLKGRLFHLIPAGDKIRIPPKKGVAANQQQRRDTYLKRAAGTPKDSNFRPQSLI
jgi:hypothetical protein